MLKPPCKDCKKRQIGCHSVCPEYNEYNKEREKYRELAYKQKMLDNNIYELGFSMKKRKRKHEDYSL